MMFTSPADVVPDDERPGLLRAVPEREEDGHLHTCELRDLARPDVREPGLEAAGFETIDLADNVELQHALRAVHEADQLSAADAAAIRDALSGRSFQLASGETLRIDLVVDDGLFHRRSGPNGLDVNPTGIIGANGHGGALYVHGDQDVFGTPLRQLMGGAAPEMFRHITPDARNDDASTFLLNLWIPLHAPVQPLTLMDRRTLDAPRHQLRYGLPVGGFLERDEEARVNDIWAFLHDEGQEWYIRTDMGPDQGYVFDTLGAPHGATSLAGEDALEELYLSLTAALDDPGPVAAPTLRPPTDATPTIHAAWQQMADLVAGPGELGAAAWSDAVRRATDAVIRRSVEMRLMATMLLS